MPQLRADSESESLVIRTFVPAMVEEDPIFLEAVQQNIEGAESRLPLELVIDILRLLDHPTLAKCAAVCRTWLILTRPSVFAHLLLTKHRQTGLSSRFADLLSHPLSTVSSLVTSLTIIDSQNKELYFKVLPLLNSLINVKSLEIKTEGAFRTSGHFPMAIPTYYFSNVTTLIVDTDFPDFSHLITFICDFPLLETLDLAADWAGPPITTSPSYLSPSLRSLRIRSLTSFILPWFLSLLNLPPIEDLELSVDVDDDFPVVNQFVRTLGPSIRRLSVVLLDSLSSHGNSFRFNFNPALEFLQIKLYENIVVTCTVVFALRQIHVQRAPSHHHWLSDIDEILATIPFQSHDKSYIPAPADIDASRTLFPRCHENGISCVLHNLGEFVSQ